MKKLCPRCNRRLVSISKKYCEVCEAKANARHKEYKRYRTDDKEQRFYSDPDWIRKRDKIKYTDNGYCLRCLNNNDHRSIDTVHHIVELKEDWSKRFDDDNLISLCESCHQVIHRQYKTCEKKKAQDNLKAILRRFRTR